MSVLGNQFVFGSLNSPPSVQCRPPLPQLSLGKKAEKIYSSFTFMSDVENPMV